MDVRGVFKVSSVLIRHSGAVLSGPQVCPSDVIPVCNWKISLTVWCSCVRAPAVYVKPEQSACSVKRDRLGDDFQVLPAGPYVRPVYT